MFNQARTAAASSENVHCVVEQYPAPKEGGKKRPQSRQLLSCTKCRDRKVKCDRTEPCSACCARGQPKECHFVAGDGNYAPIKQSYELRKLREEYRKACEENLRLKERLRASKIWTDDDEADHEPSPDSHHAGQASRLQRRRGAKQHRFQSPEWSDNLYFGSPGLANVINEFANLNVTSTASLYHAHLTHPMPVTRGADMYAPRDLPSFPFATMFSWSLEECVPQLVGLLPARDELFGYLESFQRRAYVCFFPHIPPEITASEVDRFLSDREKNTEKCPDMLALLFAALALGWQHSIWDKARGEWEADTTKEARGGDVFITAAMQALRMASFMSRPTLLGIQALIMMGPYLTNSGRFLDAWTLFGTTIRLAHSIGLHRHPKYLDPAPPTQRECNIRQTLWWWMLHMDQQYSMTLGRPLGISGIGDCPPPYDLTTDQTCLRFGAFVHQFTILARHILSSDRLTTTKIDEFTDSLRKLLDTLPVKLQFKESWLNPESDIPEWPHGAMAVVFYCKIHNYLILLNRRRIDKKPSQTAWNGSLSPAVKSSTSSFQAINDPTLTSSRKSTLRGRPLVLSSSEDLLTAFLFFYHRVPAALVCWTIGQQAFNSCMILILDALEIGDLGRIPRVEQAYAVFDELEKKGVHKLASLAVERVSWGLNQLHQLDRARRACSESHYSGNPVATTVMGSPPVVHGAAGGDMSMQGAATSIAHDAAPRGRSESEAAGFPPGELQDTVMGNAGMFLLEDPGLQSFAPEAFSPFSWEMAGGGMEVEVATSSTPKELSEADLASQHRLYDHGRRDENGDGMAADNLHNHHMGSARSSEQAHGGLGSVAAIAAAAAAAAQQQHFRYTTTTYANESPVSGLSSTPPQSQSQSQSRTSPTTPSFSPDYINLKRHHQDQQAQAPPVPQQQQQPGAGGGGGGLDPHAHGQMNHHPPPPPPHLRHHSYPSILQPALHANGNPGHHHQHHQHTDQAALPLFQTLEHAGLPLFTTGTGGSSSAASARQHQHQHQHQHLHTTIMPNSSMPDPDAEAEAATRFADTNTPLQVNALHDLMPEFAAQPTLSWAVRPAAMLDTHFGNADGGGAFEQHGQQQSMGMQGMSEQGIDMGEGGFFWE